MCAAIYGRPMMKFESGYTVETVFDGSKLGIEPYSVEVLPGGELLVLDSANSNLYRISASLSLCECLFCFVLFCLCNGLEILLAWFIFSLLSSFSILF